MLVEVVTLGREKSDLKAPGARGRWPHGTVTLRVEALPDHFVTNEVADVATASRLDEVEAG